MAFPSLPFLVFTTITPFAARAPYIAVAAASFKTVIDSMSLGAISPIPVWVTKRCKSLLLLTLGAIPLRGMPSTIHIGSVLPVIELAPRIRIEASEPGLPL